jgi:F-type H+-transporting ATPase subunit b
MTRFVSLARGTARFDKHWALRPVLLAREAARFAAPLIACLTLPALAFALDVDAHEEGHGGEHGEHGWDQTALIASFVNFFILLFIFVKLGKDKIAAFLKARKAEIEDALSEAARLKAEAAAKHREYSERLAKLDDELAQIKRDMIEAGTKERDRIVAEAEQKAARMRREAEFIIEQQVKQLRADLLNEAAETAVTAAEELLLRTTTSYDQQRLAQEYLRALAEQSGGEATKSPSIAPRESHA